MAHTAWLDVEHGVPACAAASCGGMGCSVSDGLRQRVVGLRDGGGGQDWGGGSCAIGAAAGADLVGALAGVCVDPGVAERPRSDGGRVAGATGG